jgi:putative DNA primase/helicase
MSESTADRVIRALENYGIKQDKPGKYHCNSPFRVGSNSMALSLKIDGGEYGTWNDHVSGEKGSLYTLAQRLGIEVPTGQTATDAPSTKRTYDGLADYAAAHYADADVFIAAGWRETVTPDPHGNRRPALSVPTKTGVRYRFIDGDKPTFKSPAGYRSCWYGLERAAALAAETESPLILTNGEPSVIVAQSYGVPAAAITGGAERALPAELISEMQTAWPGPVVVALDCDDKGRKAAAALVAQLQQNGVNASAVDMRGSVGFDLADWCGLHKETALRDLLACQVPETLNPTEELYCSDLGNGRRLVAQHGDDLRYVAQWGWLVWDGRCWRIDDTGDVHRRAQETVVSIYQEAADAPEHKRAAIARWAIASQSHGKIQAMMSSAESHIKVRATPADFDNQEWLLSCTNGTVDLQSGELRPHSQADLLTKTIPVAYNAAAECPRWLAFLDRIFDKNAALIGYVQRMIGYMLSGSTGEQCMFIAHGTGANGKSVMIDIIRAMLGDYAKNADPSTFLVSQSDRIRSDLARLAGVRFVATVELDEGRRLSEALVKQVTGGDLITARFLNKNDFEFQPRFKLLMATNHKPVIRGTDYAIWRRIKLIPFAVTIPEAERDPRLADKLKAELPGILAWAVRGCLEWQRSGLQEPAEVSAATSAYRSEMDIIGQFLDENCVTGPRYEVACAKLYAAYDRWCDEGGERSINQRRFGAQMSERGIQREHRRKGWVYIGVGLVTDHYDDEPPPARKPAPTPAETPQETIERDLCDPCDPNSPIFTREEETWERSGKLDHIDHMDHTSEDLALAVNAPLSPPGPNFPWASVRLLLEQGRVADVEERCIKLWKADPALVIAEAREMFPTLAAVIAQ